MRFRPGTIVVLVLWLSSMAVGGWIRGMISVPLQLDLPAPESQVLNINQATIREFETLPGIGPVLAARIVAWRDTNGPFHRLEDLREVRGIGAKKFERISLQISERSIADNP